MHCSIDNSRVVDVDAPTAAVAAGGAGTLVRSNHYIFINPYFNSFKKAVSVKTSGSGAHLFNITEEYSR